MLFHLTASFTSSLSVKFSIVIQLDIQRLLSVFLEHLALIVRIFLCDQNLILSQWPLLTARLFCSLPSIVIVALCSLVGRL